MSYREVVFAFEGSDHVFCGSTLDRDEVELICVPGRELDGAGVVHLVHVLAPEDLRKEVLSELEAAFAFDEISSGDGFSTLSVTDEDARARLVAPLEPVREALDDGAMLEPFLGRSGRIVARIHVPRPIEDGDVLRRLRDAAGSSDWTDWQLVHLTDFHPGGLARDLRDERLSTKQLEVVKMGLALGFYDSPRGCTLKTLADLFGISKAAVHNRLKAAERKILASYFS